VGDSPHRVTKNQPIEGTRYRDTKFCYSSLVIISSTSSKIYIVKRLLSNDELNIMDQSVSCRCGISSKWSKMKKTKKSEMILGSVIQYFSLRKLKKGLDNKDASFLMLPQFSFLKHTLT